MLLVFGGIVVSNAQYLPYKDTGSIEGKIISVEVTGNSTTPLVLKKGTHVIFTINFRLLEAISGNVSVKCSFSIGGVPVPLPVVTDPFGATPAGTEIEYLLRLNINNNMPPLRGVIKIEIVNNATGKTIISFEMPAEIVENN